MAGREYSRGQKNIFGIMRASGESIAHPYLFARLVHLHACAVDLVFLRGLAEFGQRLRDVAGRLREHGLERLEHPNGEARETGASVGERLLRDRGEIPAIIAARRTSTNDRSAARAIASCITPSSAP